MNDLDELYSEDLGLDGLGEFNTTPMEKHSALLEKLTDFDPYLKELMMSWLAVTWDEKSQEYVNNPGETRVMNIKGASWCIGFLRTYTRKNNIITTINSKYYNVIMREAIMTIGLNVGLKYKEFGITNLGDVKRVITEMTHAISLALMGAGDGKYNQLLKDTTKHGESTTINPYPYPMRKAGLFEKAKNAIFGTGG